jgi:hypothetical protein
MLASPFTPTIAYSWASARIMGKQPVNIRLHHIDESMIATVGIF